GSRAGKAAGTLSFNGEPGSTDPVMLTGSTASPAQQLTVSPASHNFGNATVNTVANAALTLTNSGGANLTISRITVSGASFDASPIKVPATVPAGGNIVLELTFSPRTTGNFSG